MRPVSPGGGEAAGAFLGAEAAARGAEPPGPTQRDAGRSGVHRTELMESRRLGEAWAMHCLFDFKQKLRHFV